MGQNPPRVLRHEKGANRGIVRLSRHRPYMISPVPDAADRYAASSSSTERIAGYGRRGVSRRVQPAVRAWFGSRSAK